MKKTNLLFALSVSPLLLGAMQIASADETNDENTSKIVASKENQNIAEKVVYNGKEISMKKETKAVKNAKPVTSGNNAMGSDVPKPRTGCDVFTVGDQSRPRQDFVDVSSYQSSMTQKDFNTLKSRGVKGIVVKLTEGTYYQNPYAKQQIAMAKKAGMQVSVYHFSQFQNKAQAESEADFFAKTAKSLGLGADTLMVNDIESPTCNNGYATQNSVYFALRLIRTYGINAVLHYGYQNWFDNGVLSKNVLGSDSIWEAGYPYSPSANNLWYKGTAEAWQFTSTMRLPSGSDYKGNLDGNIDYTGRFTKKATTSKPSCTEINKYVSITKKDQNIYNDTDLNEVRQSSTKLYSKTYHAKRYYTINGKKYYSLYDHEDKWQGYASEDILKIADDEGGIWWDIPNKYVKATKVYPRWETLDSSDEKKGETIVGKQYVAKGEYHHFNGEIYYSLYDKDDHWVGYTNKKALEDTTYFGDYHSDGRYFTLTKSDYNVFADRNRDKSYGKTGKYIPLETTYHIKGYYDGFDGTRYFTVYEKDGEDEKWVGYINANAFTLGADDGHSRGGAWIDIPNKVITAKKEWSIWNDLNFDKEKGHLEKGKQYEVRGKYNHYNHNTYYSLYNKSSGKWIGYANEDAF